MTEDLFTLAAKRNPAHQPLAERIRPRTLDEIVGQDKLLGPKGPLRRLIERGEIPSILLWGPPGSGKTTLARLLANYLEATFETISAVMAGIKDLREVVKRAKERQSYHSKKTLLFIDEIHRFNKAQQDALLPHVESGLVTLVGATTENPSFEVNSALLSRVRVFVLQSLSVLAIEELLRRAMSDSERGLGKMNLTAAPDALRSIAAASEGDARRALGTLQLCCELTEEKAQTEVTTEIVEEGTQTKTLLYDKNGEQHYGVISAFIKSMRGSDPDAALYWMTRMLEAGEAPRFILRRMVIFASEDIGNANPQALQVAVNALQAFELVGLPEGTLPMTQAVTYLACSPKSNSVIKAYTAARKDVREYGALAVPKKFRNATTALTKDLGYGKGYKYPHNFSGNYVPDKYLPDELHGRIYYEPGDQGAELDLRTQLNEWRQYKVTDESEPTKS